MGIVDTGSQRAISPCGTEAMLQLICSILDCNHGALQASLVLWLGMFLQIIVQLESGTAVTHNASLLCQYLDNALL